MYFGLIRKESIDNFEDTRGNKKPQIDEHTL